MGGPRNDYLLTQKFIAPLGLMAVVAHPTFFLLCRDVYGLRESLLLRALVAISALPLLLYPKRGGLSRLAIAYWEAHIAFDLLTVFWALLIVNEFHPYWFASAIFAGMLYGLVADRRFMAFGIPIGVGLGIWVGDQIVPLSAEWEISALQVISVSGLAFLVAMALRWAFDQLYAQLLHANSELQVSERQRSAFFQNVSHELRTPLTLIAGPIEAALDNQYGEMDEELRKQLSGVKRSSQSLLQLINQLLELSKLDAGAMQLNRQRTNLGAFLCPIVAAYESTAARRDMLLSLSVPEIRCIANVDRDRLEIVINNLLSNAFKFTERGGKVRIELSCEGSTAHVRVRDTGCGIPPDKLPVIFDRFAQADASTTRRYEGTGIGLSLVKEIVELHGGTVSVTSEPGFGSEFLLTLPILRQIDGCDESPFQPGPITLAQAIHDPSPADEGVYSPEVSGVERGLVLVVEDNTDLQRFIAKSLTHAGFRVRVAGDGEVGLHAAQLNHPDLIITDVMMPRMDGMELLRRCRSTETLAHVPFIVLTAKAGDESLLAALRSGADDYVTKPFRVEELTARVERLLQLRRLCGENEDLKDQLRRASQQKVRQIAASCEMVAGDLHVLQSLFAVDVPSALNKIRFITEKILHALCKESGTNCGDGQPTVERMVGPLASDGTLPRNVAIHVRTIQTNTSPGSHFQPATLSEAHALIAEQALFELLEWFFSTHPHAANGVKEPLQTSLVDGE